MKCLQLWTVTWLLLQLSGCTNVFFQPMRQHISSPEALGIAFRSVSVPTADNQSLHGWLMTPKADIRGTLIFFHGNAENISTHFRSVAWLTEHGYQVLLTDYRGYGLSDGAATLEGAIEDIKHSAYFSLKQPLQDNKPIFILGQSLGAALSIVAFAEEPDLMRQFNGFIFEASFANFRQIAQEALGRTWLTWLFQYPLSLLITAHYNPEDYIQYYTEKPVLLLHSREDSIIPYHHAEQIRQKHPGGNLHFQATHGAHIASFNFPKYRAALLTFLAQSAQ